MKKTNVYAVAAIVFTALLILSFIVMFITSNMHDLKPHNWVFLGVFLTVIGSLFTTGLVMTMECDNEAHRDANGVLTEKTHYPKLILGLVLITVSIVGYSTVMMPAGLLNAIRDASGLHETKYYHSPLIHVPPTLTRPDGTAVELKPEDFDIVVIEDLDPTSTATTITNEDGNIHVTVVLTKDQAKDGVIVPKNRIRRKGEAWFQDGTGKKSWLAAF